MAATEFMTRAAQRPVNSLVRLGGQATFYVKSFTAAPRTLRLYKNEVLRLLADISWGSGAILVGGGTIGVMLTLSLFTGTQVGIEGFNGLEIIGLAPLTGFLSAYANTRELAPIAAALAFAAQMGCRYTAQLGSMRIAEEVDALEVMGIPSIPYLVTTRMIAAFGAILPLYLVGLFGSYVATEFTVTFLYGQSRGTYLHYFYTFLNPIDIVWSVVKIAVFAVLITLIHCYFGYNASGGPQGVGQATGRAIRTSIIITIVLADMFLTLAIWGYDPGVRLSG
jgi:phospholipid/cholesterol/gamma-HCH transport system permease protein